MRIGIYVQSSWAIGLGHTVRSAHLARELLRRGHEVVFVADMHQPGSIFLRAVEGASWGTPFVPCDIAVLDYMLPTVPFAQAAARNARRLVLLVGAGWGITSDLFRMADLLVFQTGFKVYGGNPKVLSGGEYVILGPEYAQEPPRDRKRDVLIVCGGGVPLGYSAGLADAMSEIGLTGALVVAPQHVDDIEVHGWEVVRKPMGLWPLQSTSRLQIGTMGMSSYEALAAGAVPVMVGRSQDHVNTADSLEGLGVARSLGMWDEVLPERVADEAAWLLVSQDDETRMRGAGRRLVDGHGAQRVAEAILG